MAIISDNSEVDFDSREKLLEDADIATQLVDEFLIQKLVLLFRHYWHS